MAAEISPGATGQGTPSTNVSRVRPELRPHPAEVRRVGFEIRQVMAEVSPTATAPSHPSPHLSPLAADLRRHAAEVRLAKSEVRFFAPDHVFAGKDPGKPAQDLVTSRFEQETAPDDRKWSKGHKGRRAGRQSRPLAGTTGSSPRVSPGLPVAMGRAALRFDLCQHQGVVSPPCKRSTPPLPGYGANIQ